MRDKAFRRHKADAKMWRRLKEDRNQHYNDLACACYKPGKAMAHFREQPKLCSKPWCCGNPRRSPFNSKIEQRTMQERRALTETPHDE